MNNDYKAPSILTLTLQEERAKRQALEAEVKKKAYLVEGTQELRQARIAIATFSIPRAKKRVEKQLRKRHNPEEGEVEADLRNVDKLEGRLRVLHCHGNCFAFVHSAYYFIHFW